MEKKSLVLMVKELCQKVKEGRENLPGARSAYYKVCDRQGVARANESPECKAMYEAENELKADEMKLQVLIEKIFSGDRDLFERSFEKAEDRKDLVLLVCDQLDQFGLGVMPIGANLVRTNFIRMLLAL